MPAAKRPRFVGDRDSGDVILSPTSSSSSSSSSTSSSSATATAATATPTPFLDDVKSVVRDRLQTRLEITERLKQICRELLQLSPENSTVYSAEYLRFMHLKAAHDVDGEPSILAPSPAVDELWHKHLLDTVSYKMLENLLLPNGGFIHHNPFEDEQDGYTERLQYTLLQYQDCFLTSPPYKIWGDGKPPRDVTTEAVKADIQDKRNDLIAALSKPRTKSECVPFMEIFVETPTAAIIAIKCYSSDSVDDIKGRVHETAGIPPDQQRLIIAGKQLEDGRTLSDNDLRAGDILHLVLKQRGC
jgi:ubiquitin-large subunit ribosomal protein L40e